MLLRLYQDFRAKHVLCDNVFKSLPPKGSKIVDYPTMFKAFVQTINFYLLLLRFH